MPIKYKIDIMAALKDAGYNTNKIRSENSWAGGITATETWRTCQLEEHRDYLPLVELSAR